MDFWKVGLLSLLCAASAFAIGAVELGRHQPTERISGGVSSKFDFLFSTCFIRFSLSSMYRMFCWFDWIGGLVFWCWFLGLCFQLWWISFRLAVMLVWPFCVLVMVFSGVFLWVVRVDLAKIYFGFKLIRKIFVT